MDWEGALPGEPGYQPAMPEELYVVCLLAAHHMRGIHPERMGPTNAKRQYCWSCPRCAYQRAWDRTRISKLDEYPSLHPSIALYQDGILAFCRLPENTH